MSPPLEFKLQCSTKITEHSDKMGWCKNKACFVVHWFIIFFFTTASFFTGISRTNISLWNMTLYCNEEKFNQHLESVNKTWTILLVFLVSLLVLVIWLFKMYVYGPLLEDFLHIVNYYAGLLLSWDLCFLLQNIISYPIPSFFQDSKLKNYYCSPFSQPKLTKQFYRTDMEARGSFPSFLMCSCTYATVYLFLLCSHFDDEHRFAVKLLSLLGPATVTFVSGWFMWQFNENHLHDLVGGTVIGAFFAIYIAWDTFIADKNEKKFSDNIVATINERDFQVSQLTDEDTETRVSDDREENDEFLLRLYFEGGVRGSDDLDDQPPPPYSAVNEEA